MQAFNIICAIIFVLIWVAAMWKGQAFLALPLSRKLIIAGVISAYMLTWILVDHAYLGQ